MSIRLAISLSLLVATPLMAGREELSECVREAFGGKFDPAMKYVIAIQGVSTGGKTTFAKQLEKTLLEHSKSGCKIMNISTDSFYIGNKEGTKSDDLEGYDFDNPAALDWEAMIRCFNSYISPGEECIVSSYAFKTNERTEETVPNPGYNIIIVEGIFAHNLFNQEVFNIAEYDPRDSLQVPKQPYVVNNYNMETSKFKVLKIFLDMKKKTMFKARVKVDSARTNRSKKETIKRLKKFVYPAVVKWVRPSGKESDITLSEGTRNIQECSDVFRSIVGYFGVESGGDSLSTYLRSLDKKAVGKKPVENVIPCRGQ